LTWDALLQFEEEEEQELAALEEEEDDDELKQIDEQELEEDEEEEFDLEDIEDVEEFTLEEIEDAGVSVLDAPERLGAGDSMEGTPRVPHQFLRLRGAREAERVWMVVEADGYGPEDEMAALVGGEFDEFE